MRIFLFFMMVVILVGGGFSFGRYFTIKEKVHEVSISPEQLEAEEAMAKPPPQQSHRTSPSTRTARSRKRTKRRTAKKPETKKPVAKPAGAPAVKTEKTEQQRQLERKQARERFLRALTLIEDDRIDRAVEDFEWAIAHDRGLLSEDDKGLLKEVFFRREQAHEHDPENQEKLFVLARIYYIGGLMDKAGQLMKSTDISRLKPAQVKEAEKILAALEEERQVHQARLEAEKKRQEAEVKTKEEKPGEEAPSIEDRTLAEQYQIKIDAKIKEINAVKLKLDSFLIQKDMLTDEKDSTADKYDLWKNRYYRDHSDKARTRRIVYKNNLKEAEQKLENVNSQLVQVEESIERLEAELKQLKQEQSDVQ